MSTAATKQDLAGLGNVLRKEIRQSNAEILEVLQTFMHQVDDCFNRVEARQDATDQKIDRLVNTIDGSLHALIVMKPSKRPVTVSSNGW